MLFSLLEVESPIDILSLETSPSLEKINLYRGVSRNLKKNSKIEEIILGRDDSAFLLECNKYIDCASKVSVGASKSLPCTSLPFRPTTADSALSEFMELNLFSNTEKSNSGSFKSAYSKEFCEDLIKKLDIKPSQIIFEEPTHISGTNISGANISGTNINGINVSGTKISATNINDLKRSQIVLEPVLNTKRASLKNLKATSSVPSFHDINNNTKPFKNNNKKFTLLKSQSSSSMKSDPVVSAMLACEQELRPIKEALNAVQSKLRNLNMPELDCILNKSIPDVPPRRLIPSYYDFNFMTNKYDYPNLMSYDYSKRSCPGSHYCYEPSILNHPCYHNYGYQQQGRKMEVPLTTEYTNNAFYSHSNLGDASSFRSFGNKVPVQSYHRYDLPGSNMAWSYPFCSHQYTNNNHYQHSKPVSRSSCCEHGRNIHSSSAASKSHKNSPTPSTYASRAVNYDYTNNALKRKKGSHSINLDDNITNSTTTPSDISSTTSSESYRCSRNSLHNSKRRSRHHKRSSNHDSVNQCPFLEAMKSLISVDNEETREKTIDLTSSIFDNVSVKVHISPSSKSKSPKE